MKFRIVISQWGFKGNTGKLLKLGANYQSRFFFRLASDLFRTLCVFPDQSQTEKKKPKQCGITFYTELWITLYKNINQTTKGHPNRKTCNLWKAILHLRNVLLQLKIEFCDKNSRDFAVFSDCVLFLRECFPGL